ncbi:hypothetical protein [Candidatus Halobonum tyrrellensis]|uniref:Uncharacterized protein n=1 Tax=Candidatus Halobonum tyrrellensis G22 TaxID=1324957 RepID=V4GWE8_9EURY|nr:hypothetical protein [Candidatus Halobonum tyrrellensis]ESP89481.1 hypothetical protein K933_03950 [Candidatus Halobonum tyrrellensis G22]
MAADEVAGWLAARSRATLALLGGSALALVGYRVVRLGGTDPDSVLAYVGASALVVGQVVAVVGLVVVAWRVLEA